MKKVMRQVGGDAPKNIITLSPVAEETVAEEVVAEQVKVEEVVAEEPAVAEEHVHGEDCDHDAEEQAPKRSRKKQAEASDAE